MGWVAPLLRSAPAPCRPRWTSTCARCCAAEPAEVADRIGAFLAEGYRHLRVQCGGYGGATRWMHAPEGALPGAYFDPAEYTRTMLRTFEYVRGHVGDQVELLHDVHERLRPIDAIRFACDLERFRLFFLEDALAPEDLEWFALMRQRSTTPLAMGELFNHPREWTPLIAGKLIDFIRMHVSQMGGITPARKVAAMAEAYGIRTAWHGPGDVSPVGHAANLHLDLAASNFGVQEWPGFPDPLPEVFPGCPEVRKGYMYPNDRPGLGIDIDEALAKKFPPRSGVDQWTQSRLPDGTLVRP